MNFKLSYFRITQKHIRFMSSGKPKNHYDSLGIPSSSTQSEVKSAYYKLSMQYHPDKNQSAESSAKFRDITEAYEVLGNTKTRKLYDKGFIHRGVEHEPTINKFHKSRETRSRPPPPTGKTPIYDFDEWSKSHYGSTFRRRMEWKKKQEFQKTMKEEALNDMKVERVFFVVASVFLLCIYLFREEHDYDQLSDLALYPSKPKPKTE